MTKQIAITTETNVQVQVSRRGRPADINTAEVAKKIVADNGGKSLASMIVQVINFCTKNGMKVASVATITKYLKIAMSAAKQKIVDSRIAEKKIILATLNLQVSNLVRAGVQNIKEAANRLVVQLQKKGVYRSAQTLVKYLKTKKAGVFTSNPVGRPKNQMV